MYDLITLQPLLTANLRLSPSFSRTAKELCLFKRCVVFCWRAYQSVVKLKLVINL